MFFKACDSVFLYHNNVSLVSVSLIDSISRTKIQKKLLHMSMCSRLCNKKRSTVVFAVLPYKFGPCCDDLCAVSNVLH